MPPMRFIHDVPIKRKLTLITMFTTTLALALACAGFTVYDQLSVRRELIGDLSSIAAMLGFNSASALSFNDPASAEQTLKSLSAQQHITAACIYDRQGFVLAQYFRAGERPARFKPADSAERAEFLDDRLEVLRTIQFGGEEIGRIFLQSDLTKVRDRLALSGLIFLVVMLGAGLTAYLIVSRLQQLISDPILQLATVAGRVATDSNYSVRATKLGNDEVGALIDGFNEMLAQIQSRDAALQRAHDELEKRVEERTSELLSENIERRHSEDERDRVFTLSLDFLCIARFDGFMRRVNPALATALGLTMEQVETMPYLDIVHPDDRKTTLYKLARLLRGRSVQHFENRCRCADGTYRSVMWTGIPFHEEKCFYAYGRDVTELKLAQERAAQERARFKFIFDSVPVGISLVVPGQQETHVVNPAHLRISGIAADAWAQPGAFERATHPDDVERQRAVVARYKRGEIDHFALEKRYIHPDGRIVWVALTRRMFIDAATGQQQSITTIIDITELKHAQEEVARERERFKMIFNVVPVGISLATAGEQDSLIVNPAHVAITGVSEGDSRAAGAFNRVSHPDDYRRQMALVDKVNRGEIDHFSVEKRYFHPDSRVVWALLTNRCFPDPTTGKLKSVTTLVDITERKEAEAQLAETHKLLLDTSRQAGMAEVATGVLHNVGNVLNSANVSTTLLTEMLSLSKVKNLAKLSDLLDKHAGDFGQFFNHDARGQKVPEFLRTLAVHLEREQQDQLRELESLRKNIEHIKEIVAMQQNYAKVSGVSETLVITDLIEDAVRMNASDVSGGAVKVVRDFQSQPTVTVDKHKVLQILVNLMRNAQFACEEMPGDGKEMLVRVTTGAGRVRVAVVDNGVGIPAENLTRIFSHGFTTRKHGHGFGLHSGALAARELGGSLIAESEGPGRGATFVLELPEYCQAAA